MDLFADRIKNEIETAAKPEDLGQNVRNFGSRMLSAVSKRWNDTKRGIVDYLDNIGNPNKDTMPVDLYRKQRAALKQQARSVPELKKVPEQTVATNGAEIIKTGPLVGEHHPIGTSENTPSLHLFSPQGKDVEQLITNHIGSQRSPSELANFQDVVSNDIRNKVPREEQQYLMDLFFDKAKEVKNQFTDPVAEVVSSRLLPPKQTTSEAVYNFLKNKAQAEFQKVRDFGKKMLTPSEEITNNKSVAEILAPHQEQVAKTVANVAENVARGAGVVAKPVGKKVTKIVSDRIADAVDAMNPIIRDESTGTKTPLQALKDEFLRLRAAKHDRLRLNTENRSLDELANQRPLQYHINPEKNIGEKQISLGPNGETVVPITPELNQLLADGAVRVTGNVGRRTNRITGSSELYGLEPGPITLEDLRVTNKPSTASGGASAGTESIHPTFTFEAPEAPMPDIVASKAKGGRRTGGNARSSKPSEFWSLGANIDHATRGPFGGTGPLSRAIGTTITTPLTFYGGYQGLKNITNIPGYLQEEYKEHYGTERGPVSWGDVITNMGTDPNNLPPIPGAGKTIKHPDGTVENIGINESSASIKPDGSFTDVHTVNDNTVERSFDSDGKLKNKTTTDPVGNKTVENHNPETGKVTKESIPANNDNSSNWPSFGDWMTNNVVPEYFSNKENFGSYGHSLFGALAGGAIGAGIGGLNYILTDENELSEEEKKKQSLARAMLSSAGIGAGIGGLVGGTSDFTRRA